MPARTTHYDLEAPTAQGLSHNCVRTGAIQHQRVQDQLFIGRCREDVAHSAQISFTFFPDIADE